MPCMQIFWNAFLSTLSHAPVVDANSLDALQAWTFEQLPRPLHEQAAAIAESLYSATRPLHEQAALFAEALKLPQVRVERELCCCRADPCACCACMHRGYCMCAAMHAALLVQSHACAVALIKRVWLYPLT